MTKISRQGKDVYPYQLLVLHYLVSETPKSSQGTSGAGLLLTLTVRHFWQSDASDIARSPVQTPAVHNDSVGPHSSHQNQLHVSKVQKPDRVEWLTVLIVCICD